jgi:hypothetical protein
MEETMHGGEKVERELISLRETAVVLDVCEKTVRRMGDDGELGPVVKVRGSTKLFLKHVRAYMKRLEQGGC